MSKIQFSITKKNMINFAYMNQILQYENDEFKYAKYSENDLINFNKDNAIEYLLVFHQKTLIAYCIYYNSIDFYEIYKIFVNPNFRKRKIGTLFIDKLSDKKIIVEVSDKNKIGISFYESNGFRKINIRNNYYQDKANAIVLGKEK